MKELLRKLVEVPGPSGYETQIRQLILAEVKDYVDSWEVDAMGNLITRKGKKQKDGKTIMLAAHMDEIGVIVTHIDDNGFARFTNIGGVFPINCAASRVRFLNGTRGVIGMEPTANWFTAPSLEKMYIDLGVHNKKDCPVQIGDVAVFDRTFLDLGDRIVAKAMDDRIGVALIIETLKQVNSSPNEIVGVFTTQEEVGTRGAITAAYGVNPDLGLAVDITTSGDTPKAPIFEMGLGKGPAIKIKDVGMLADPRVVAWMEAGAEKIKIPYQREILLLGGTDARSIQVSRSGVPAGCLSIPTRYAHSPSEMIDYNDALNGVKLLVHLMSNPVKLK